MALRRMMVLFLYYLLKLVDLCYGSEDSTGRDDMVYFFLDVGWCTGYFLTNFGTLYGRTN